MRTQCVILLTIAGFSIGCSSSISTVPNKAGPVISQRLVPGGEYEIVLRRSDGPQISYLGKVGEATSESVTLDSAIKRVEVTKSPPIPLVGKMFLNKSVGGVMLNGPITIRRDEIADIMDASTE